MTGLFHGEAWLLELLAMERVPVWCLMRGEADMQAWLNRGYHNLSRPALKQTLLRLFDQGDIEAFLDNDDNGFTPSELQLQAAFGRRNEELYCGATRQGGEGWESLARPDWSRYSVSFWPDVESMEIIAGSQERLIELVKGSELLWGVTMDADSLLIEHLRPWDAKPWKALPVGFWAKVPYADDADNDCGCSCGDDAEDEFHGTWPDYIALKSWANSICGNEQL